MRSAIFFLAGAVTSVFAAATGSGCTALMRREGVRALVKTFLDGNTTEIAALPLTDNITTIL